MGLQSREIDVTTITDPKGLRALMDNARRLGREDIYWKAFRQLCSLVGDSESDPMHREFWQSLAAYEELLSQKNGRRTPAARTRQKVANKGIQQSLEEWALAPQPTEGFILLMDKGLEELTGEHLVITYASRFSPKAVGSAEARLGKYRKLA